MKKRARAVARAAAVSEEARPVGMIYRGSMLKPRNLMLGASAMYLAARTYSTGLDYLMQMFNNSNAIDTWTEVGDITGIATLIASFGLRYVRF